MVRWKLHYIGADEAVTVSLNTRDPNDSVIIEYSGPPDAVSDIGNDLSFCSGLYGHSIGMFSTPVDVDAAMRSETMSLYVPELIEGQEVLDSFVPEELDDDAMY